MKHTHKLWILPAIILALYILCIAGMHYSENRLIKLYQEHTYLVGNVANASEQEKKQLIKEFSASIKLTSIQKGILYFGSKTQKAIDKLTVGREHCLVSKKPDCIVYKQQLIDAAKKRHNKILLVMGKEPAQENLLNARAYTPFDYITRLVMLLLEAIAVSAAIIWVMEKVNKKQFIR